MVTCSLLESICADNLRNTNDTQVACVVVKGTCDMDVDPDPDGPLVTIISLFRRCTRLMVEELVERLDAAGFDDINPSHHPVFENLPPGGGRLTELAAPEPR